MHVRIETTTNTSVFNPLSPRGTWFSTTLGQRPITEYNAEYTRLIDIINKTDKISSVGLYSELGDALEWQNALSLIKYLNLKGIYVIANTYGMGNIEFYKELSSLTKRLGWKSLNVIFHVCGIWEQSNKVFLGSNWKVIKENMLLLGGCATLRFYLFKHNKYQLNAVRHFCKSAGITLEIVEDPLYGNEFGTVFTSNGEWLYDVHSENSPLPTLVKTVQGWHKLKRSVIKKSGLPIDVVKNIPEPINSIPFNNDDLISITVKGHVIKGSHQSSIFSSGLLDDWNIGSFDVSDKHTKSTLYTLSQFSKSDLDTVNIYKNDFDVIVDNI